ncbi:AAA family ATPase [Desertivirga arenae]|uniref:AAA family ATPase n=1 Tax=Desertivirga arenae TaxID=2810309 RepID=UPI001A97C81B|nr:AAA family ATPase [Pedobacter sp. SYSU D00823]
MANWHIQLHPNDIENWSKDDIKNIVEKTGYIGIGNWDKGKNLITQFKNSLVKGDYVVIRHKGPLGIVKIIGELEEVAEANLNWDLDWFAFRRKVELIEWFDKDVEREIGASIDGIYQTTALANARKSNFINSWVKRTHRRMEEKKKSEIQRLLEYKKQIILQGPPGTGKTRLAKEISEALTSPKNSIYTKAFIKERIKVGDIVNGRKNTTAYPVLEIKDNTILLGTSGDEREPTYDQIIESLIGKLWTKSSGDRKSNTLSYADSIAKFIYANENSEGFDYSLIKLVQFHPSYTYEDFVRGIVSVPNESGEGILYKAEDKTLGEFANLALDNYLRSKGQSKHDSTFQNKLAELIETVRIKMDAGEEYSFGEKSTAQIIAIKEDGFLYNFPLRQEIKYKLLFDDIEKVYSARQKINKPIDLRDIESQIGLTMKGKYPYYYMILRKLEKLNVENVTLAKSSELKNFVIIIDEINRANLSSVLGELIYALEYRGEEVESVYKVGGDGKLTLPPNLYIIGTMNTADRSVGHIDYAIRRRFAFVDVLPEDLSNKLGEDFKTELFNKVAELFTEAHISPEFKPKDVQLGHSYFIQQYEKDDAGENIKEKPYDFKLRLKYEIVPILNEYLNDGVFKNDPVTIEKIKAIEDFKL